MTAQTDRLPNGRSRLAATDARFIYRRNFDRLITLSMAVATVFTIAVLLFVVGYIVYKGAGYLNWEFLTEIPATVGAPGGGIRNAIIGSFFMVGMASVMAVPIGIGAAIYLNEFPGALLSQPVRLVADVLTGVPSIVVGIFVFSIVVQGIGLGFSGYAGAIALAFIMVPIILIMTQEAFRLVPMSLREAALALGIPRWRVILSIVLPAANRALITGLVIAVARAAGETAPLIVTALGNRWETFDPSDPMAAIPLIIYRYASGPYQNWHEQAWAAAFILIVLVIVTSFLTRLTLRQKYDQ